MSVQPEPDRVQTDSVPARREPVDGAQPGPAPADRASAGSATADRAMADLAPVDSAEASTALPPSFAPASRPQPLAVRTRTQEEERRARRPRPGTTVLTVLVVIVIAALIKTFVVQWYEIPSGSMLDTLEIGDRVAVTMFDHGDVTRGDVVVFRDPDHWLDVQDPTGLRGAVRDGLILIHLLPQDSGHHLIKRVIGVPGDHVSADGTGPVYVNGVALEETYVRSGRAGSEVAFDVTVPEGYLWVMGDNRANSADSRFHQDDAHGGFVPLDDVVGRAQAVVWPLSRWHMLDDGRGVFASVPAADATGQAAQP